MKKVYIFTLPNCKHCKDLTKLLDNLNIPYIPISCIEHKMLWESVKSQSGSNLTPSIFIQEDEDGSGHIYAPIRDYDTFDDIIKIIKNSL